MQSICAETADGLLNYLAEIDISVPFRTKGRTTEHCERWSICRFLSSFANSELLSFPICLTHRDRPDFLLEQQSLKVGIEVTEVIPENDAAIDAYREHKGIEGPFFVNRHVPGEDKLRGKKLEKEAISDNPGDGWCGMAAEREWALAMRESIRIKVEKSKESGFDLFDRNWLLMYDSWPLPVLNQEVAAKNLFESLRFDKDCVPFERIFIEVADWYLWTFAINGYDKITINNLWTER